MVEMNLKGKTPIYFILIFLCQLPQKQTKMFCLIELNKVILNDCFSLNFVARH